MMAVERIVYVLRTFLRLTRTFRSFARSFATQATAAARIFATEIGVPFTVTAHGYDIYVSVQKDFHERAMAHDW
jgi:hypothetical protein